MKRLLSYNARHKCIFFFGCLASLANGVCFPAIALILSKMITILSYDTRSLTNRLKFREESDLYSLGFFIVAIGGLFCNMLQ